MVKLCGKFFESAAAAANEKRGPLSLFCQQNLQLVDSDPPTDLLLIFPKPEMKEFSLSQ